MKAKLVNIVWSIALWAMIFLIVLVFAQRASGVLSPTVCGWSMAFVKTGSMEPNVPVGSLIFIHEQDTYHTNDVITYIHESGQFTATHRIISIEDGIVITQGDANNSPDKPFAEDRIIGKVVLTIPYVGFVLSALQNPIVFLAVLGLAILLFYFDNRKKKPMKQSSEGIS